jgi:LPXTG-motif cell wall-anchored protein
MLKKLLALAAVMLFATAGAVHAQDYPPAANSLVVSDTTVVVGQSVTLTSKTFLAGSQVTFTMFSAPIVLGTATANSSGVATLVTAIPGGVAAGSHRVEATGTGTNGQPLTVSSTITVGGTGGTNLPTTGSANTRPMTQIALGALAGGGLLVFLASRRRSRAKHVDDSVNA